MEDVVNLRTVRKRAARLAHESQAAENRASHGRSKVERLLDARRAAKTKRDLDFHRIDTGDAG